MEPLFQNIADFPALLRGNSEHFWEIPKDLNQRLGSLASDLPEGYVLEGTMLRHYSARVEPGVIIKDFVLIGPHSFIGAHAYLRGGVWIGSHSVIGPGCEVKSSIVLNESSLAHFNFVGDSILGSKVNMEAGSIICNHFNERTDKVISVTVHGEVKTTGLSKLGALIGDTCRIGANAVLEPGVILERGTVVGRLELVRGN